MKYQATISEDFFNVALTGEFIAKNKSEAIKQAQEHYANELDTLPNEIQIIEIKGV